MSFRLVAVLALTALLPASLFGQRKEAVLLFKDGFRLHGKVIQKTESLSDPGGGGSVTIASDTSPYLDDEVRRMFFGRTQTQDVIPRKQEDLKDLMVLRRPGGGGSGDRMMRGWEFEETTPWNQKWERTITVSTGRGRLYLEQRITRMTPYLMNAITLQYNWQPNYLTPELGPDLVRNLLFKYYADKKEMKEPERRLNIAKFIFQMGWYDLAEKEVNSMLKEFTDQQKAAEPLLDAIRDARANWFLDNVETARKVGQHATAQDRLNSLNRDPDMLKRLNDSNRAQLQDLKNHYDAAKDKIAQTKKTLKELPETIQASKPYWEKIADHLAKNVNHDTVGHLETFTTFAQQYLREVKENRKPTQKIEEVMALAITGWLQGNSAAEPDVKLAKQLWAARTMILELQKTENPVERAQMAASLAREAKDVPIDMLARMIKMLPPPVPYDKIDTDVVKLDIEVPDAQTGSYYLQLPPDYHPRRAYPVLLLLHGAREKPADMIARFTELAAQNGYIVAAPLWGKGLRPTYAYSAQEHAIVLDTLRDLRRWFQVDSDRVFMLGWEAGGEAAYDIGLSHPDQFAGVLPMNGKPQMFSQKYHTNAQYLPFYAVDGDQNGSTANQTRKIFKDWVRWHYPCLYVEYQGRGSEWYGAELVTMFDWMNRKKRHHPTKELGRPNNAGFSGEQFKTMRACDNKFYWVGCDGISERSLNDSKAWDYKVFPATLTASVHTGNELVVKKGGKEANIWNQINIRAINVKQVNLWLTPNFIDYTKPLLVRINGANVNAGKMVTPSIPTMLDEFYQSGDRQRLFFAKLEYRL